MLWYGDPKLSLCLMSDLLTTDLIKYNGSNISVFLDMNITFFVRYVYVFNVDQSMQKSI